MKKASNETVFVLKKYVINKMESKDITINNFYGILEIISAKISGLVTEIEDNHNNSQTNVDLLNSLDKALDELNENDIDITDLNLRIKL